MSFFLIPRELTALIVENLSVLDFLNFTSTCHYLHDNPPYDSTLLELLSFVNITRSPQRQVDLYDLMTRQMTMRSERTLSRLFLHDDVELSHTTMETIAKVVENYTISNDPMIDFVVRLCERYKFTSDHVALMVRDTFDVAVLMIPLNEDLYYRLLHLLWHENTTGPWVLKISDLEKFIHLAIATDHADAYRELKSRRPQAVLRDFTCRRKNVTDQDIYSTIRYGSREIYAYLYPRHTDFLQSLLSVAGEYNGHIELDNNDYNKVCGICEGTITLKQMYQEHMEGMSILGPCLPD